MFGCQKEWFGEGVPFLHEVTLDAAMVSWMLIQLSQDFKPPSQKFWIHTGKVRVVNCNATHLQGEKYSCQIVMVYSGELLSANLETVKYKTQ